ncbi:hypothetical protein CNEO2_260033 [Clostridium neonatale]|nr:hypothetical protein CNEO2_260033 [Clostridium neonatale]CAI3653293.1 hypothetical protein CNEO4_340014 [Clostridium neonatale]
MSNFSFYRYFTYGFRDESILRGIQKKFNKKLHHFLGNIF